VRFDVAQYVRERKEHVSAEELAHRILAGYEIGRD
jgi:hypothetical protein